MRSTKPPITIALTTDKLCYEAGEIVTGHIYLSVHRRLELDELHCPNNTLTLHLSLQGNECVEIDNPADSPHDYQHSRASHAQQDQPVVDHATHTLVHTECPVPIKEELTVGKSYKVPFQWKLPLHLPSSLRCTKSRSVAEIRYSMQASLDTTRHHQHHHHSMDHEVPHAQVSICVRGQSSCRNPKPIHREYQHYPVVSCCCHNRGSIALGWYTKSDTVHPGDIVPIHVKGDNYSSKAVESIMVSLVETVFWSTHHGRRRSITRTIATRTINTKKMACWKPKRKRSSSFYQYKHRGDDSVVSLQLLVPSTVRDSYHGSLVQVRHELRLEAQTKGCLTMCPESTHPITIQRKSKDNRDDHDDVPSLVLAQDESSQPSSNNNIPLLETKLEERGQPCLGKVVEISPQDEAVWDHLRTPTSHRHDEPTLPQLVTLVRKYPETVRDVLEDAAWATLVQNLSPQDFCSVLLAARGKAPLVAEQLGQVMKASLEYPHIVACLQTLPDCQRMEVVRRIAPIAYGHPHYLEQELSSNELAHFHAALHDR